MTREEAIEVVKERLDYYERGKRLKAACEVLIPELAESEDERIREQLIDAIKIGRSNSGISFTEEAASRYIAWLEKHSEEEIRKIRKEEYTKGFNDAAFGGKLKEWSEEDEKIWNHIIDCAESRAWIPFNEISWLVAHKPQFHWKPSEEQNTQSGKSTLKAEG